MKKLRKKILSTQFGIYDITDNNLNVCLELGIAIGGGKPYYIILKRGAICPANLQGLDRIEYESYKHLTAEIKSKIVKVELKRLIEMEELLKQERKYDKIPEEEVRRKCIRLYKADELFHRFGSEVIDESAVNKKAWFADLSEMSHHIIYGPYQPLLETGEYVAFFRIKIDDNSLDKPLLVLDVTGGGKTARVIRGIDFDKPLTYQLFGLKFKVEVIRPMEYRIFNIVQQGKIWVDYVAIVKVETLTTE